MFFNVLNIDNPNIITTFALKSSETDMHIIVFQYSTIVQQLQQHDSAAAPPHNTIYINKRKNSRTAKIIPNYKPTKFLSYGRNNKKHSEQANKRKQS